MPSGSDLFKSKAKKVEDPEITALKKKIAKLPFKLSAKAVKEYVNENPTINRREQVKFANRERKKIEKNIFQTNKQREVGRVKNQAFFKENAGKAQSEQIGKTADRLFKLYDFLKDLTNDPSLNGMFDATGNLVSTIVREVAANNLVQIFVKYIPYLPRNLAVTFLTDAFTPTKMGNPQQDPTYLLVPEQPYYLSPKNIEISRRDMVDFYGTFSASNKLVDDLTVAKMKTTLGNAKIFEKPFNSNQDDNKDNGATGFPYQNNLLAENSVGPFAMSDAQKLGTIEQILKRNLEAAGLTDAGADTAMQSLKNQNKNLAEANDELAGTHNATIELQRASNAQERRIALDTMDAGARGLIALGGEVNCKALTTIGQAVQFGTQVLNFVESINNFQAAFSQMKMFAVLGPIGIAAGAAAILFNFFSSPGPNPHQLILDEIDKLHKGQNKIFGAISDLRRDQARALVILRSDIAELKEITQGKMLGMRTEIRNSLLTIDKSLDYLKDLTQVNAENQYLQSFKYYCVQADRTPLNEGSRAKEITRGLENVLLNDTRNDILTGYAQKKIGPPNEEYLRLLKKITPSNIHNVSKDGLAKLNSDQQQKVIAQQQEEDLKLNWFLGYLFDDEMQNPFMYYQAAEQYIKHIQKFFALYADSSDATLDEIIVLGELAEETLEENEVVGKLQPKIDNYYTALENVKTLQDECINKFNNNRVTEYNRDYITVDTVGNNKVLSTINFLSPLEELLNQFKDGRSIAHIKNANTDSGKTLSGAYGRYHYLANGEYIDNQCSLEEMSFKIRVNSLHEQLKNKNNQGMSDSQRDELAIVLAAEYLQLIQLNADINDMEYPEILHQRFGWEGSEAHSLLMTYHGDKDSVHGSWYLKQPFQSWNLTINIQSQDQKLAIILTYSGDYSGIGNIDGLLTDESIAEIKFYKYSATGGKGNFHYKLRAAIPEYVAGEVEKAKGLTVTLKNTQTIKQEVENQFLRERDNLVSALTTCKADGELNELLQDYQVALNDLDIAAAELKIYSHISGKKLKDKFILDSAVLHAAMKINKGDLTKSDFTPELTDACKNINQRITPKDFVEFEISNLHPKNLLSRAINHLKAHAAWRQVTRVNCPWLRYHDIQHYWANKNFSNFNRLREENYKHYSELRGISSGYVAVSISVQNPNMNRIINEKQYQDANEKISDWTLVHSKDENATGLLANANKKDILYALDRVKLERGWEHNVGLLTQLAAYWGVEKITPGLLNELVNFSFWADGAYNYTLLLNYPAGTNHANGRALSKPRVPIDTELTLINKMYKAGENIQKVIIAIAFSDQLFKNAFDAYTDSFTEVITEIIKQHTQSDSTEFDGEIFTALFLPQSNQSTLYATQGKKFADKFNQYRLILINYINMAFGEYSSDICGKLFNAKTIVKQLKDATQNRKRKSNDKDDKPLDHGSAIRDKTNEIIKNLKAMREKILDQVYFNQSLVVFSKRLEHYSDNDNSNTLKITQELCMHHDVRFSREHIDLIDQFLSMHPHIDRIELWGIPLTHELTHALVTTLRKHASIRHITLACVNLKAKDLSMIAPLLPQLNSLDLRSNLLGESIDPIDHVGDFLSAIMQHPIAELNLSDNKLCSIKSRFRLTRLIPWIKKLYASQLTHVNLADNNFSNTDVAAIGACLSMITKVSNDLLIINLGDAINNQADLQKKAQYANIKLAPLTNINTTTTTTSSSTMGATPQKLIPSFCFGQPLLQHTLALLDQAKETLLRQQDQEAIMKMRSLHVKVRSNDNRNNNNDDNDDNDDSDNDRSSKDNDDIDDEYFGSSEKSVGKTTEQKLDFMQNRGESTARGYIRHRVDSDGDCGYTAFGIVRGEDSRVDGALRKLNDNIMSIRNIIQPAVKEALRTEEFIAYLNQNGFNNLTVDSINLTDESFNKFANDMNVIQRYINYDVRDKKINAGWTHPSVLQALAHIQKLEIRIWRLGEQQVLVPHKVHDQDFSVYTPANKEGWIDLLFVNDNHFERLEFEGYGDKKVPEGHTAIYPLKLLQDQTKGISSSLPLHYAARKGDQDVARKGLTKISAEALTQLLNLPQGYIVGKAKDGGDCFFDALAQTLNESQNTNSYSDKSLRMACHRFYKDNKKLVDEWNNKDYGGTTKGDEYYLIQYTKEELDKAFNQSPPVWGRPKIEGIILCKQLNISGIHLIEIINDPANNDAPIMTHFLITEKGEKQFDDEKDIPDYGKDFPTIVVTQKDLHFVPVLSKGNTFDNQADIVSNAGNRSQFYPQIFQTSQYFNDNDQSQRQNITMQLN